MALFAENVRKQLKTVLDQLQDEVTMAYFSQEIECQTCQSARQFVNEIASLSDKLKVESYNLVLDKEKTAEFNVDKVPAIVLLDKDGQDTRMKFFGIPGGYEINSFLGALLAASGKQEVIPKPMLDRLAKINKPVHIQVFVSLGCPHCPNAVMTAHLLALANKNIQADMVEASTFNHLAIRYNVSSVPKIIFNEQYEFTGSQPIGSFLDMMEKL